MQKRETNKKAHFSYSPTPSQGTKTTSGFDTFASEFHLHFLVPDAWQASFPHLVVVQDEISFASLNIWVVYLSVAQRKTCILTMGVLASGVFCEE